MKNSIIGKVDHDTGALYYKEDLEHLRKIKERGIKQNEVIDKATGQYKRVWERRTTKKIYPGLRNLFANLLSGYAHSIVAHNFADDHPDYVAYSLLRLRNDRASFGPWRPKLVIDEAIRLLELEQSSNVCTAIN